MKRIGITGGIGAGKSAVSHWLRVNGLPVYDSDAEAKRLMNESADIRLALTERMGQDIYRNGLLDSKRMAELIFADPHLRSFVNGVVHPAVISDFMGWSYSQGCDVVFVESAILYDCNLKDIVDGVIFVDAPLETRIERAMKRDGAKREAIEQRVRSQRIDSSLADWIINNDGELYATEQQIHRIAVLQGWVSGDVPAPEPKKAEVKKTKTKRSFRRIFWKTVLVLWLLSILWVVLLKFIPVWYTPLMFKRCAEAMIDGREPRIERTWVPFDEISPHYFRACLASEDNLFPVHYGFSEKGIKQAWENNKKGKKLRGGSTISQQTAKNVFTFCSRTWFRKGIETYYTILIELIWGKERIMEVYCNIAEMGDGVYGVEAAAQRNFHRSAKKLNASQAALIVAALPNPRVYSISHPGPYMRKRQSKILWLMPKVRQFPEKKK